MNRRGFLKMTGGGVILAAATGGAFVTTRRPDAALAPWQTAGTYVDPRMNALSHAILAPNPHNRQPWIVRLDGDDGATLFFDTEKQLPHTDPFDRQLTIGLGCFLELMRMAAAADGYAVETKLFPQGEDAQSLDNRPVATVRFTKSSVAPDALFDHVMQRRSNKEPFDTDRTIHAETLSRILQTPTTARVGGSIAPDDVAFWRALTTQALHVEIETPRTFKESVDLFRIGKAEINANPDGIDFGGPLFEALSHAGIMTREASLDTGSQAYIQGVAAVTENTQTAMGHLWLVSDTNTRADQIACGADWLRINLACTREGLGFQPLSQPLQEYPEMSAHFATTHARLAPGGGTVQMLARIGYGPGVEVSPRWPIEAKIGTM
ncbi:Acg family FMN-binding oxidoreductase [Sulfitobacter sp. S190]|uniref:Acg family FMN-binding oxidoreductase n=1 Tax=Sulfitobacter sp. S190 TaxID=2867022 RepID=UPI0021A4BED0|nr:twin-arginine translocation pathway signal protein [Sulfitobacter sp. S190]UWR23316.1 twin-arginine translocation pathway signal protein [Sulfitobacter sp. S190]